MIRYIVGSIAESSTPHSVLLKQSDVEGGNRLGIRKSRSERGREEFTPAQSRANKNKRGKYPQDIALVVVFLSFGSQAVLDDNSSNINTHCRKWLLIINVFSYNTSPSGLFVENQFPIHRAKLVLVEAKK